MCVLKFTLTVLAVAGSWRPALWTSLFKHTIYNAYTTIVVLTLYTFSMSQLLELVLNAHNADSFGDALFNILISLLACYKTLIIRINQESITTLINNLIEVPFKPLDPFEIMIREKFDRRITNNTFYYSILILISVTYIVSLSFITQFKNGELLYKAWLPFNCSISTLFYFAYLHQVMSITFIAFAHPTSDSLICGLLLHICCQIEILEYRLSNIANGRKSLRDCVYHHTRIFEYACMLNDKFARIVPSEFTMVTIVMTYDLIHMTMSSSNTDYIQNMVFIASTLAAIFYYCWFGNELKLKIKNRHNRYFLETLASYKGNLNKKKLDLRSLQLSDNIYNMEWTTLNDNVKKGLLMIMNRATIPIEFKGAHMPMNLESFVAVLKTSYSLFNVLIQSRKQ